MNLADIPGVGSVPVLLAYHINLLCDRHEAAWRAGGRPRIEDVLTLEDEPRRTVLLRELLAAELAARRQRGEDLDSREYRDRFPSDTALIEAVFAEAGAAHTRQAETGPRDDDDHDPRAGGGSPGLARNSRAPEMGKTVAVAIPIHDHPSRLGGAPAGIASPGAPAYAADGPRRRYRILRLHVRGGLGDVFVAFDEELRREVALKAIRPERAGEARSQARFLLEAEITGRLEHPGIIPIYGLDRHADGRPYYAMRFVQGHTLKEAITHCPGAEGPRRDNEERPLALRQLLRRFIDVCNALAYAHSRGVLHRDIKPSNILLGPFGETLIVDWGLAKPMDQPDESDDLSVPALRSSLAGDLVLTETGSTLGTPGFMSPEQAAGRLECLGLPSDVYSLGATLYCILTGRAPIDERSIDEALRKARDGDFPPPRQVRREVDAALEAICLKAMARDPEDRYPSAIALAEDLERWMADEPVAAWAEPWTWKMLRWLTRHRTAVIGAAAAVLVGLVGLAALAALQSEANRRLQDEKDRTTDALIAETKAKRMTEEALAQKGEALAQSEVSRKRAEAVLAFLKDDVLAAARPEGQEGGLGKDVTVRGAVDAAVARIAGSFQGQPTVEAEVRDTLGTTYYYLGELSLAIQQYERATELRRTALGPDHPDTLTSRTNLANAELDAGRAEEAARMDEETLQLQMARLGPEHTDTLTTRNNLANDYYALDRMADSARMHEETLRLYTAKLGPDDPLTLISRNNLAAVYRAAGQLAEAARMHEETLRLRTARFGPEHPETLRSRDNLAETYAAAGRLAEAARMHEETLRLYTAKLGPDHPDTLICRCNLAADYLDVGRAEEAARICEETLRLSAAKLGPDHPDTLICRSYLANAYLAAGRVAEAARTHEETLRLRMVKIGPDHPSTLQSRNYLAKVYEALGRRAEAEALRREALTLRRRTTPGDSPLLAGDLDGLGHNLLEQARWLEAESLLRECLSIREAKLADDWRRFDAMGLVGAALMGRGEYTAAEPLVVSGYEGMKARAATIPASSRARLHEASGRVVRLYEGWNKPDKAAAWKVKLGLIDLPGEVFAPALRR
jgi:eukaryotic-like serine/threonine-protein kinase